MSYFGPFFASLVLYFALFIFSIFSKAKKGQLSLQLGLIFPIGLSFLALIILVIQGQQLPTHYLFERFLELGFGLSLLLLLVSFFEDIKKLAPVVLFMTLLLFAICLFSPMKPTLPSYRYSLLTSQLFFQLEAISFILMSFSAAYCFNYLLEKENLTVKRTLLNKARIYLLFGFVVFLASQFIGSLWSLNGWGDYFVWGKMTFIGIVVWFYIMFVVHVRYLKPHGDRLMALSGSLIFLIIIIYRLIWQP